MPEYLKKTQTPILVNVTIKKVFDEKVHEQYGGSTTAVIIYKDVEYYESFKPKNYYLLKEGNELVGTRKMYDGKPYFEWFLKENEDSAHHEMDKPVTNEAKVEVQKEERDNKELSIVTQSILHIDKYYDEHISFEQNATKAVKDAKWFLDFINKQ